MGGLIRGQNEIVGSSNVRSSSNGGIKGSAKYTNGHGARKESGFANNGKNSFRASLEMRSPARSPARR